MCARGREGAREQATPRRRTTKNSTSVFRGEALARNVCLVLRVVRRIQAAGHRTAVAGGNAGMIVVDTPASPVDALPAQVGRRL